MSRIRPVVATACLAALLFAALPAPGAAKRDARNFSVTAESDVVGASFIGSWLAWGRAALGWLQAIVAAEHGQIVAAPATPPPPTP